ncbi:MAG: hypothetical protein ACI85I_000354 [Arenicella sp.]|jgi:hypothetical protein
MSFCNFNDYNRNHILGSILICPFVRNVKTNVFRVFIFRETCPKLAERTELGQFWQQASSFSLCANFYDFPCASSIGD